MQVDAEIFRERLRLARSRARLSQDELATRTGLTQSNVSQYESGHVVPSIESLARLSHVLKVSTDWLLGLTDKRGDA